ncbi:MAG: hypothetical protein J2O47_03610 [Acidimicrobiaceae bacterium]|nr:hypothetical protein [Acidimicrobiaceae bacterium]
MASEHDIEWSSSWIGNHQLLTLSFARGLTAAEVFQAYGCDPGQTEERTFEQVSQPPATALRVRKPLTDRQRRLLQMSGSDPRKYEPDQVLRHDQVRVGIYESWVYAVEATSVRGSDFAILSALAAQDEAFSFCFTPKIDTFLYAEHGTLRTGFDLTVLHTRWGSEPRRFDDAITAAGFRDPNEDRAKAAARFLQIVFDLTITQDMLEQVLPCAALP